MLLGIISDTHDEKERTQDAVNLLCESGAEALIHCGDITRASILEICSVLPCWFVFGNHDADNVPELEQVAIDLGVTCLGWVGELELNGRLIAVAHGHMRYDIRRLLKSRPHYLLTGHSHFADDTLEGVVRRINPGALHRADEPTVGLLDLKEDRLELIAIHESPNK